MQTVAAKSQPKIDIHPTAQVAEGATLGKGVVIGPFCVVGSNVKLGDDVRLHSHAVVEGSTIVGAGTQIFPFASVGMAPQDLKYAGEASVLKIGCNNRIREYVTMQPGTKHGGMITKVGDNGNFMAGVHIAHDCEIGDNVNMANNATLGGHVIVEDNVNIGGLAAVHQFVRIGRGAMIGGMAGINSDVIPYAMVMGRPSALSGFNLIGLKRRGASREEIDAMMKAFKQLFANDSDLTFEERVKGVALDFVDSPQVMEIIDFIQSESLRKLCMPQ